MLRRSDRVERRQTCTFHHNPIIRSPDPVCKPKPRSGQFSQRLAQQSRGMRVGKVKGQPAPSSNSSPRSQVKMRPPTVLRGTSLNRKIGLLRRQSTRCEISETLPTLASLTSSSITTAGRRHEHHSTPAGHPRFGIESIHHPSQS